jgi:hypothetical protein
MTKDNKQSVAAHTHTAQLHPQIEETINDPPSDGEDTHEVPLPSSESGLSDDL